MSDMDKNAQKEAFKEALTEWLDKQFSAFGRWAIRSMVAVAFTAIIYMFLISQGWSR